MKNLTLQKIAIGRIASKQCAEGLFSMKELHLLELHEVNIDDGFFVALPDLAPKSQVFILFSLNNYLVFIHSINM